MKIALMVIGKTSEKYLQSGIEIYSKRLKHYCTLEYIELKDVATSNDISHITKAESDVILSKLKTDDFLVLLDEKGEEKNSRGLAQFIEKRSISSSGQRLVFLVGGAFGVSEIIKQKAEYTLSLSKMTFSHQMIRLFLVEQLYRAFTIIRNEKYHND